MKYLNENQIAILVPEKSYDYQIDDFLSNRLQYKIDGKLIEDNSKLPNSSLIILDIITSSQEYKLENVVNKKWLLIGIL